MRLICNTLVTLMLGWLCTAETIGDSLPAIEVSDKGALKMEDLTLSVSCFKPKTWAAISQTSKYFHVKTAAGTSENYQLEGVFQIPQLPEAKLSETLKQESTTQWRYHAEMVFPEATELAELGLCTALPIDKYSGRQLLIDGKEVVLPLEFNPKSGQVIYVGNISEIVLPTLNSKITFRGKFHLVLQDSRAFSGNTYSIRILFSPPRGKIDKSSLALTILLQPFQSTPLDLSAAVTTNFTDEVDGDRSGGWTDQGAENDLRMLPLGKRRWSGTDFEILDPAKNNGKSCIVLAGSKRSYFPSEVKAPQEKHPQGNWLYLLHALAWPSNNTEIGSIALTYKDGTRTTIPVVGNVDVGNWWGPIDRRNGDVVWTGENKNAFVGLYRSAYPIANKPIKDITFRTSGISVWGIVAASVSADRVPKQLSSPAYIIEGKDWKPIIYHKDFEKGSILDFSHRLDAPAGKYGPLMIRNDHFVFRDHPEKPVRFYGTNLCGFSQYQNKKWAEKLADRIASLGYNAVRFHHHDNRLGLRRTENDRSTDLDPEYLDQLDYLMACLKKRGIYYTTDLYVSRETGKGEIPEFPDLTWRSKKYSALVFVLPSAMENWKAFARNWLTHVNPYTGLALKDDPALITLSLINEDNIATCWYSSKESIRLYQRKFKEWKKEKNPSGNHSQQFTEFLVETHNKGYNEMKNFIRSLGVKTMLSDQNMSTETLLSVMRTQYDFVDNHFYWDHPSFPEKSWRLPSSASNLSAISKEAKMPGKIFPTQLLDRPMTITEFDYAKPNFYRAEGAVLTGAYAALQGWDALFQFAYSHSREKVINDNITEGHFDTATDVVKSLAQRIGIRLFLDGELKSSPLSFAAVLTDGKGMTFNNFYSNEIARLGLIARVGTLVLPDGNLDNLPARVNGLLDLGVNFPDANGKLPVFQAAAANTGLLPRMAAAGALKPEWFDLEKGIFNSSTGQISLNSKNETFKVVTKSCEALILPAKKQGEGNFLRVNNKAGRGVFSVMSVDGKPLTESARLLLLHLTDSQGSKIKFKNATMTQMETWGTVPFLAARGVADIDLATASEANYTLYSVDTSGKRLEEIPIVRTKSGIHFPVNVFTDKGSVFVYELERK